MFPRCSAQKRPTSTSPTGVGFLLIMIVALTPPAAAQDVERDEAEANERDRARIEVAKEQAANAAAKAKALEEKKLAEDRLKKAKVRAAFQAFFKNAVNAVGRPKPAVVQIQLNDAQLRQFENQYKRHFDQIVATELHFIRVVCRPTKQEFEQIASDCENVRKETVRQLAVQRGSPRRGTSTNTNPRTLIADGLVKSVKRRLSADQARRYETQVAQRREARKRAAMMNLVATVDRKLVLTAEQRDKLTEILKNNWDDSWAHTQKLLYAENYFPSIPSRFITPVLTEAQKKAISKYNNRNVNFGIDVSMIHGLNIPEEQWDDPMESIDEGQAR